jgi:hypothetical protein
MRCVDIHPIHSWRRVQVMYADEWASSFIDAFGDSAQVKQALALQREDVAAAAARVPPGLASLVGEVTPLKAPPDLLDFIQCRRGDATTGSTDAVNVVDDASRSTPTGVAGAADQVGLGESRATTTATTTTTAVTAAPEGSPSVGTDAGANVMGGTSGGVWSPTFLSVVRPLYDIHMGVEHMAPLLYALIRFTKPSVVLEVGAGYTTPFMLQALADNHAEMVAYASLQAAGRATVGDMPWCAPGATDLPLPFPILRCVDNLAHEHTTAHLVIEAAQTLGEHVCPSALPCWCRLSHVHVQNKKEPECTDCQKWGLCDCAIVDVQCLYVFLF